MKNTFKLLFPLCLLLYSSIYTFGQVKYFSRGHNLNDVYIHCWNKPINTDTVFLLHLDENGAMIRHKIINPSPAIRPFIAETVEGRLVSHDQSAWKISDNYGASFEWGNLYEGIVGEATGLVEIYGGESPGELITEGLDYNLWQYWPNPVVFHKTFDYGATYILIADSSYGIANGEIGISSGELYQLPVIDGKGYFCHSLNYGLTFDTIPIDTTILNENQQLFCEKLSHGASPAEGFLVIRKPQQPSGNQYFIYHTTNAGLSWSLQSSHMFSNPNHQQFTAGREPCSFYMANLQAHENQPYYELQIYYSNDCGVSFTKFSHWLSANVGIGEHEAVISSLKVSPNPVNKLARVQFTSCTNAKATLQVRDIAGRIIVEIPDIAIVQGNNSHTLDFGALKPGVYTLSLCNSNTFSETIKFVKY